MLEMSEAVAIKRQEGTVSICRSDNGTREEGGGCRGLKLTGIGIYVIVRNSVRLVSSANNSKACIIRLKANRVRHSGRCMAGFTPTSDTLFLFVYDREA